MALFKKNDNTYHDSILTDIWDLIEVDEPVIWVFTLLSDILVALYIIFIIVKGYRADDVDAFMTIHFNANMYVSMFSGWMAMIFVPLMIPFAWAGLGSSRSEAVSSAQVIILGTASDISFFLLVQYALDLIFLYLVGCVTLIVYTVRVVITLLTYLIRAAFVKSSVAA